MSGVNKVIIVGRLGADPEYNADKGYCSLSLATSEKWNDKESGEVKERTEWHRVKMFGKLAELASKYLVKGREVYIEGRLQTSSYEKDGVTKYSTDIMAQSMNFLGGKSDTDEATAPNAGGPTPPKEDLPNFAPGSDSPF